MTEWKKVKFGDFISLQRGYDLTREQFISGPYPVVSSTSIMGFHNSYKVNAPGVVIGRSGTLGEVQYVKDNYWPHNTSLYVKDFKGNEPLFVYYFLKNFGTDNAGGGAAVPTLNKNHLYVLDITIPSKPTQHRIATILSRYDSLIENYQRQIKLLEESAQRLYKEWFVDYRFPGYEKTKVVDGVPEGWEKKNLVELVDVQYGYAFDGMLFNNNGEGMPILRIRNIPDGMTSDFTTEEAPSTYIVHNGDIVVGMDGIFHINSWCGGDAYLVQRACSFRPYNTWMKGFIFQAIQEPIKFYEKTLVGSTVAHLGKKHIDSIEFVVPKDKILFKPLQILFDKRQGLLSQIRLLTEARDRLLPKLMSGEIKI